MPEHMKLVDAAGKEIADGAALVTFRGEPVTLTGRRKPQHRGSTGRIYVRYANGSTGEFYPSVCGLEFVDA